MKRTSKALLIFFAVIAFVVSLTSCMNEADYYTKDDVTSLITALTGEIAEKNAALEEKISTLKSDCEAKIAELEAENKLLENDIDTLTADYKAAVTELEAADKANADALAALDNNYKAEIKRLEALDKANADAIAKVEADYKAAVTELEAVDKANADALVELDNKYTVKLNEINATISANTQKITSLESALADEISNVKAEHEEVVAELRGLIAALEETSEDNVKRIAKLEAEIEALLSKHEHTYGEWIDYRGNDAVYCENRLFYRICTECSVLEWKSGTYDNHSFSTVTTPPTCVSMGYDTKTCSICGKIEKINETPISDHIWKDNYSYNNSFHWIDCNYCDAEKEKAEHTTDESGYCTVCDKPVGATEGIIYEISSDGAYASVVGYDGTAVRVKIADMYEGVPVTELCAGVFQGKNIVSVIIPNSITSIGDSAFSSCYSLTSVTIGDGVETLGEDAFAYCSKLSELTLGNSIKRIGSSTFSDCDSLTSVTIPDSVTSIGSAAFSNCSRLTSVTIGNSLTSVGSQAFSYCNSALYTEYNYGKYVGDSENPYSVLIELTNKNFTTYDINEETKIIAANVFEGCARLNSIVIPDSVTSIGSAAFSYCDSLTSVVIPDSVTSIGSAAFSYCDSLTSVHISDIAAWCNISFVDSFSNPQYYAKNLYVGGTLVEDLVIPEGVTSIGNYAFYNCSSLTNVVIPDSVTSIGEWAFSYCTSLTSVTIPDSVTSIGDYAFYDCYSLTSVYISDIAAWCNILFGNSYSTPLRCAKNLYVGGTLVEDLVIPEGVTSIGNYAFYNCDSLTSVVIPDSVTSIGRWAFEACSSLTDVYYGGSKEEWEIIVGNVAFASHITIHFDYVKE